MVLWLNVCDKEHLALRNNFRLTKKFLNTKFDGTYRKVASSNTSRLEAHAGFFRLLMKGIFDPYVL